MTRYVTHVTRVTQGQEKRSLLTNDSGESSRAYTFSVDRNTDARNQSLVRLFIT